jgi:hypothetical protein
MIRSLTLAVLLMTALYSGVSGAAQRGGHWQLLGEQEVDFKNDHDRIDVKRSAGPFRQLRVEIRDAPIEIREMTVTFGDGRRFKTNIRGPFREGSETHVIDLPGNRRSIDGVDFVYQSLNRRRGKGRVLLYGR